MIDLLIGIPGVTLAIVWFVFAMATGFLADANGRTGAIYFFAALILSPLMLLIVWSLGPGGKPCPRCAETVRKKAEVCRHCGHEFSN